MNKEITVYTDGCSIGNPGPGGYAAVLIWGNRRKEIFKGFRLTTNNRMEIMAAYIALASISNNHRYNVKIHTDSRLLTDSINKGWAKKWRNNGWMRNNKEKALNHDLWELLLAELDKHNVSFVWIKAHSGIIENERCDLLAKKAASEHNNNIDVYYESFINN